MIPVIELIDFKGDYWSLVFGAIQISKRTGRTYVLWHVGYGPSFLNENGAHYDMIPTPVFTEWWSC